MKKFDFYGQMVLIIIGLLLAIPFDDMSIAFAGLVMFATGVWQLISTIVNLANEGGTHKTFFRNNLFIAIGYIIVAIILWELFKGSMARNIEDAAWYIMMGIPPLLISRYWIGISKIYDVGFFKKKTAHE
ncbi:MAG: hypothetical protein V4722_13455 [Bacteroidota bacterium]